MTHTQRSEGNERVELNIVLDTDQKEEDSNEK